MGFFLKNNNEWDISLNNFIGLPRPLFKIPKTFKDQNSKNFKNNFNLDHDFYLHNTVPVPWQSKPNFDKHAFNVILINEEKVYTDNLCPYCGVKIKKNDIVIRWIINNKIIKSLDSIVFSDIYPFHKKCMKQARIFCPYMRTKFDDDFEIGTYDELINNVIINKELLILNGEKNEK